MLAWCRQAQPSERETLGPERRCNCTTVRKSLRIARKHAHRAANNVLREPLLRKSLGLYSPRLVLGVRSAAVGLVSCAAMDEIHVQLAISVYGPYRSTLQGLRSMKYVLRTHALFSPDCTSPAQVVLSLLRCLPHVHNTPHTAALSLAGRSLCSSLHPEIHNNFMLYEKIKRQISILSRDEKQDFSSRLPRSQ